MGREEGSCSRRRARGKKHHARLWYDTLLTSLLLSSSHFSTSPTHPDLSRPPPTLTTDPSAEEESLKIPDMSIVESSAELLYGLIHQRYIITRQGLQQMVAKYEAAHFGSCPRVYCNQTKVLPSGRSDLPGVDGVKLFCPNCLDTYTPPSSRFNGVDGAFFGTTFPHLLFQQHPELVPVLSTQQPTTTAPNSINSSTNSPSMKSPSPSPHARAASSDTRALGPADAADPSSATEVWTTPTTSAAKVYIPRIYGFKVSERARSGPRMQWLRLRPQDQTELDRVDHHGRWKVAEHATTTAVAAASGKGGSRKTTDSTTTTTSMTGVQRTPTSTLTAPQATPGTSSPAVRPSRSRQKLGTPAGGSTNDNDDTLPPRKSYSNSPALGQPSPRQTQSPGGAKA